MLKISALLLAVALSATPTVAQDQGSVQDPWTMVRALEGIWEGEGAGFGQMSKVTHEWRFILDGKFLRLETKSVSNTPEGEAEVHEDVGYVSWSESENTLRFRQFLSEGFVNTFVLSEASLPDLGIDFDPENTEGMAAFSAGMTLRFTDTETYEMVLAMGPKGTELKACQTMTLHKLH